MLAQKLRHRVDIQRPIHAQDSSSGAIDTEWDTIREHGETALIAADVVPLSGREFIAAAAVQAGVTTRITIRWRPGVEPDMRVLHQGDVYNIRAVLPDKTLRRHLTLMCETGVNQG